MPSTLYSHITEQSLSDMAKRRVIVVGGGASGLMAAGQAAANGADVLLLEKTVRPGQKLRLSGKGRCNLTNHASRDDFLAAYGKNGRFLTQAYHRFFSTELITFFQQLGIELVLETGGRYFPRDHDADAIGSALERWGRSVSVKTVVGCAVRQLCVTAGTCAGILTENGETHSADAVILATGGMSYPETGSTGDGYVMAAAAGHTIHPTRPALVPVVTSGKTARMLQGLSLRDVTVQVLIDGKRQAAMVGDLLFTHFGLSGPVILPLSRMMVDGLRERCKVEVSVDLAPSPNERTLDQAMLSILAARGGQQLQNALAALLPERLVPICLEVADIAGDIPGSQVTRAERERLGAVIKDFRLTVNGHRPFTEAFVTAGGVDLREIDPYTMQSRLVQELYFAGEVIDIDGPTGGYNLQAAFSTGWLAGRSAAGAQAL